jgi:hypothetical protein
VKIIKGGSRDSHSSSTQQSTHSIRWYMYFAARSNSANAFQEFQGSSSFHGFAGGMLEAGHWGNLLRDR